MAQVDLTEVINTGRFDFERARQAPGWLKEIRGEHVPETIEYGITSFTYKARRPFHPARLCEWTNIHFILEQPVFGDPMMEGGVKGPSEIEDGVEENSGDLESKTEATGSSTAAATAAASSSGGSTSGGARSLRATARVGKHKFTPLGRRRLSKFGAWCVRIVTCCVATCACRCM